MNLVRTVRSWGTLTSDNMIGVAEYSLSRGGSGIEDCNGRLDEARDYIERVETPSRTGRLYSRLIFGLVGALLTALRHVG